MEALVRYSAGDYTGAAAAYRANVRDWFGTAGLRIGDEEMAVIAGDVENARKLALAALERDPGASGSLLTLVEVALDENDPAGAVRWVERALDVVPANPDALLLATIVYARAGDDARALRALMRELRDWAPERRIMTFYRVLGETGRLAGLPVATRPSCLLAYLHRYLRIDDDWQARLAIARAEEAIAKGDHVDDAYVTIGVVHQKRTEDEAALAAFLRAIDVNPRNAEAYRWAAVVYADRGDLANEYRMARSAYESEPDDPAYAIPYARVLMNKMGAYEEALAIDTKALASGRPTPTLLEDVGYLHASLDHGAES
ncbi:MAG TPA: tetratricopeptide repeat protein, partial [Candidatus Binatia bacterium]|nr:tetratricopeptide repeat protein [Candidatus Binatia bacterium]